VILPGTGTALAPIGNEMKHLQHRYEGRQTLATRRIRSRECRSHRSACLRRNLGKQRAI